MKKSGYQSEVQAHRIRITLTSQSTANIEKGEFHALRCAPAPPLRRQNRCSKGESTACKKGTQ